MENVCEVEYTMQFLTYLINGISLGSVYALIALGYTMVYGIAKMLNFAHGDVIMIGSNVVFFAFGSFGLNPIVSVLLSMLVCTILGITIERVAYRPLRGARSLAVLISAMGVSYLLQQVAQLLWKSDPKSFRSVVGLNPVSLFGGQLVISGETIVTIAACLVIMIALTFFINHTPTGHAMLAVSEDRGAAQLMGVNVNATISLTFAIGSALAAVQYLVGSCDEVLNSCKAVGDHLAIAGIFQSPEQTVFRICPVK